MIPLATDQKKLVAQALDLIEACRTSQGIRAAYCRQLNAIAETGRQDGTRSLLNKLYNHLDRLASHLYSPTDLRFTIDYENPYPKNILDRGSSAAKILTRDWERSNTDMIFGRGVFESLKYGSTILKQWVQQEGSEGTPVYYKSIVMPWQFGVYREDVNELSRQSAMCETSMLTLPEVWRRIFHLPNAEKLFARVKGNSKKGGSSDEYNSFFHQVLSTATLSTGAQGMTRPVPGGIVQLNNDPNYAIVGPQIDVDLVKMHELWVQGEDDYVTIQLIEPDILIAPLFKHSNLLISGSTHSGLHPYNLIQPNEVQGYFWGRSELSDLIEPQGLLSTWCDDAKRLMGLQIDKILAFTGYDGLTDETYDQMRGAGYFNGGPGSQVTDLTPKFPPEMLPMIQWVTGMIDQLGGFDNILAGKGEPGVRAGSHAQTLLKTAAPRLRDRSLLVERQLAAAADLRLSLMEAKDPRNYWTDGTDEKTIEATSFKMADLPEDRRVAVDSHSGSPIFADDHTNLMTWGVQSGIVDPESAIEDLPFPNKDTLKIRLKEKQAKEEKLFQEHPELLEKAMGGKKHK